MAPICKRHPPVNTVWPEPCYKENGVLAYPFQEGIQQPPVPQGYKRKADEGEESWQFVTKWEQCSYRQRVNERLPRGDLQINTYCTARNNTVVTPEECKQCLLDVAKIGGSLNKRTVKNSVPLPEPIRDRLGKDGIPNFPSPGELLDNYWKAVKRWVAGGRVTRTDLEVAEIHKKFCSLCNWYDPDSHSCKGCGCKVRPKGMALLNKIKMKTEKCPQDFWQ